MGRWFSAGLLVVAFLVAALLVVPTFVNWNQFRGEIERQASRLIGREVTIKGDIGLELLPRPSILLGDVTLADPKSGAPPALAAGRLEVTAAWFPLLLGKIEIARLVLVDPFVRVRIEADGKTNWDLAQPAAAKATLQREAVGATKGFAAGAIAALTLNRVRLSDLKIESGTIDIEDLRIAARDTIEKLSGVFKFPAGGPWAGEAGFELGGESLGLAFDIASIKAKEPSPAMFALLFPDGRGRLELKGNVAGVSEAVRALSSAPLTFKGKMTLGAEKAAPVAEGLVALSRFRTPTASRRAAIGWDRIKAVAAGYDGSIAITKSRVETEGRAALGKTKASVKASRARDGSEVNFEAASDLVYLGELVDVSGGGTRRIGVLTALRGPIISASDCACSGSVKLTAAKMILGDGTLSNGEIRIGLKPDGARLETARADLPGETSLTFIGDLPKSDSEQTKLLIGAIAFASADPRTLLGWLGVETAHLPPQAFRSIGVTGPFLLIDRTLTTASGLRDDRGGSFVMPVLDDVELKLDEATYRLTASLDERPPRAITFKLEGETLDADAYGLGGLWWPDAPLDGASWGGTLWGEAAARGNIDLGVKLSKLLVRNKSIGGIDLAVEQVTSGAGRARVAIEDIAGYRVLLEGAREPLEDPAAPPNLDARLTIAGNGQGKGSSIELPLAGKPIPGGIAIDLSLKQREGAAEWRLGGRLGPATLTGSGSGGASSALLPDIETLNVSARMTEGTAALGGSFRNLTQKPSFDGNLTIDALDFVRYLRALGYVYNPRRTDLGAFSVVAQFSANADSFNAPNFAASVGSQSMEGTASADFTGLKTRLKADIRGGKIDLDGFLEAPDERSSWSTDRLATELLTEADGSLRLSAEEIEIGPYEFKALAADFILADGALTTSGLKANLYDGLFNFSGRAAANEAGLVTAFEGKLEAADFGLAASKLIPVLKMSGRGRASFRGTAEGRSLFGLVSTLGGTAEIEAGPGRIEGIDLKAWSDGLRSVQSPESFLRLARAALSSGATTSESLKGRFTAKAGVIRAEGLTLKTIKGPINVTGGLKLPVRTMDVRLDLPLADLPELPMAGLVFTGPISAPERHYDLRNLQAEMLKRFEASGGGRLNEQNLPPDLRELLKEAPKVEP